MEQPLAGRTALTYRVTVGPALLTDTPAAVVQREDGFYLEPGEGGSTGTPVLLAGGVEASTPVRLSPGDSFQVGGFVFSFET